jgi:hypothetical protein
VLDKSPAVDMLIRVVGADRVDADPAATGMIVDARDGLPLAIRIAGVRLQTRAAMPLGRNRALRSGSADQVTFSQE